MNGLCWGDDEYHHTFNSNLGASRGRGVLNVQEKLPARNGLA